MAAVTVDDVRKIYGDADTGVTALDGVSIEIEQGEIFGLLGPNGAGKTTLVKILSTLVRPTSGRAEVAGINVQEDPSGVRARIGLVFQEPSLDNLLSGRENLELSAALYSLPRNEAREGIDELLEMMDLAHRGDDEVKTYSGGMKRRLEIARGLLHDPDVLFLDEPTLGLDPQSREKLWEYIKSLREQGTTVLMTTHYMEEADELCDRVAIIDHGRIEALDTPDALKAELGETVIRIQGPSRAMLEQGPEVESVEVLEAGEGFLVQLVDGVSGLPAFLRGLDELEHIEVRTTTLQDVFLSVTGRELREEEGGDAWMEDAQRFQRAGGDF